MLTEIITISSLEIMTGVDNALAASALLARFNEKQRRFYLTWGLAFACLVPRLILPLFLFALVSPDILMPACACVLIGMVVNDIAHEFSSKKGVDHSSGWGAVIKLEFMDVLFSLEAVVGAMVITDNLFCIFLGGLIGTLALREMTVRIADKLGKYVWLKYVAWVMILVIAIKMLVW